MKIEELTLLEMCAIHAFAKGFTDIIDNEIKVDSTPEQREEIRKHKGTWYGTYRNIQNKLVKPIYEKIALIEGLP